MTFCIWKTGRTVVLLFCLWGFYWAVASTLWAQHSIYLFCTSSSEKRWKNPQRKISAWTLEDERCCHFPHFYCFSLFVTSRLTREKSFFSFSTICPGMQILLDRIICLQAMYNADGGLDNKSRSPSPILVGVIVFWPCVRHFSHTVVTTLVSATILFGKVYSQSQISLCLKHSH